jgi:hypothetical protein
MGRSFMAHLLPHALVASVLGLCWVVYKTQKHIWALDMAAKKKNKK